MRSIVVDARPGPAGLARIETALAVTRLLGGHLRLVVDTPVERFVAIDGMGGSIIAADALRDAMAEDDAFAAAIAERLTREDVCCDVVRADAAPVEALAAAALLADLVVVSREDPAAGDLPLAIAAPVLAVSGAEAVNFPLRRAVIAWDGGTAAANAVRAAVPLLASAGEVQVVTVEGDGDPIAFPATDVMAYLSRHDIKADLSVLPRSGSVSEVLCEAAAAADLLVAGCYGHGRLREFLFGGVTRGLLEAENSAALLLAH